MAKKFGSQRHNMRKRVYKLRTKDLLSWVDIGEIMGITPRMANRLFQELAGKHQHHDHLPGKGGRFPSGQYKEDGIVVWKSEEGSYLPGDGTHNTWEKTELPH